MANFLSSFINSTQSDVTATFISYTTEAGYYSEILRTCAIGTFLQGSPEFNLFGDGPACETAGGWLYDSICISD